MNIKIPEKQKNLCSSTDTTFYIVGPKRLQNELIATYLQKEAGNPCILVDNINQIPTDNPKTNLKPKLLLWDCHEKNSKKLLAELRAYNKKKKKASNKIVFFNMSSNLEFNKRFILKGIHGFFYEHDSLDIFLKGVRAVLDGKLWLSRDVMTKCIFEGSDRDKSSKSIAGKLTERQTEILALIAVGATNEEIGDKLCISLHTVKTHLYKIFRIINVPNRVQASLWAAKNI
jgi:LuxR family transcriptional regulator of csgAB operon